MAQSDDRPPEWQEPEDTSPAQRARAMASGRAVSPGRKATGLIAVMLGLGGAKVCGKLAATGGDDLLRVGRHVTHLGDDAVRHADDVLRHADDLGGAAPVARVADDLGMVDHVTIVEDVARPEATRILAHGDEAADGWRPGAGEAIDVVRIGSDASGTDAREAELPSWWTLAFWNERDGERVALRVLDDELSAPSAEPTPSRHPLAFCLPTDGVTLELLYGARSEIRRRELSEVASELTALGGVAVRPSRNPDLDTIAGALSRLGTRAVLLFEVELETGGHELVLGNGVRARAADLLIALADAGRPALVLAVRVEEGADPLAQLRAARAMSSRAQGATSAVAVADALRAELARTGNERLVLHALAWSEAGVPYLATCSAR